MTTALLLPPFLSNLYDLACMLQADKVLVDDLAVFSRKSRVHRGKIRTPDGGKWISIPIMTEDRKKALREVRMDHSEDWITIHLRAFEYNYRNSIYYDYYEPEIRADYEHARRCEYLLDFTQHIFSRLMIYLQLELSFEKTSQCDFYSDDPDELAKKIGADVIYHEHKSRHYQRQANCSGKPDFTHPEYRQHFEGFELDCCLLDVLFQYGPEAFKIVEKCEIMRTSSD